MKVRFHRIPVASAPEHCDSRNDPLHTDKKRRFVGTILSLIVLLGGWITWQIGHVSYQSEPTYLGKPLTVWLEAYQPGMPAPQIDQALQAMGSNCLPTLLRLLLRNDSPLLNKLARLAQQHGITNSYFTDAGTWHLRAIEGFRALGVEARYAVPELMKMYDRDPTAFPEGPAGALGAIGPSARGAIPFLLTKAADKNQEVQFVALQVLGQIHSEPEVVVPFLVKCLDDRRRSTRESALWALGHFGGEAKQAVPAVVRRLKGSNPNVRRSAAWVLGQIRAEPALVVPALVETLEDPEDFVCEQAIRSIGEFGANAYQAQPRLRNLLHDRTPQIRNAAVSALRQIAP